MDTMTAWEIFGGFLALMVFSLIMTWRSRARMSTKKVDVAVGAEMIDVTTNTVPRARFRFAGRKVVGRIVFKDHWGYVYMETPLNGPGRGHKTLRKASEVQFV